MICSKPFFIQVGTEFEKIQRQVTKQAQNFYLRYGGKCPLFRIQGPRVFQIVIQPFQIFYNFVTAPSYSLLQTNFTNVVINTNEF